MVAGVGDVDVPAVSTATPAGLLSPLNGSTVWVVVPAANFSTLLLAKSAT